MQAIYFTYLRPKIYSNERNERRSIKVHLILKSKSKSDLLFIKRLIVFRYFGAGGTWLCGEHVTGYSRAWPALENVTNSIRTAWAPLSMSACH